MASQVFINKASSKVAILSGLLLFIAISIVYTSCTDSLSKDMVYANHSDAAKYVGMATCASCHEVKHSTFIHTGMGLSFDTASHSKSSAVFGLEHQVYDSFKDLHYFPFWKDDKLYVREYRLIDGDTSHKLEVQINHIVGSGQHTNSHLFTEQGFIYQAPITFYVQEQKWDLAPGFENGNNSRFSRILNSECISCHNSMPKLAEKSDFKFTEIGNGIDCERCHGPGSLHVTQRAKGEGVDVKTEIDPTIVNPRKLSWERQIDLCQRCHLQGLNVLKDGKKFTDFKPGMKLSDIFEIYLPEYEGENASFDMANHSQRFQMSECFIQGNKEKLDFTCISCHNPHVSVKMTGTEVYNTACKNCHQVNKCKEDMQLLIKAENNCVSCHMPPSGSEDIPHVSVHDHYIRVPKPAGEVAKRQKLVGLYAVNNAIPDEETEIRAYLEYWEKFDKNPFYLRKAKEKLTGKDYPRLWLKYYYLTEEYAKGTQQKLDIDILSSWELFILGESYGKQKAWSQATFYLQKAWDMDPTVPSIGKQLLKYRIEQGDLKRGATLANELVAQFPRNGNIINLKSKVCVMSGKYTEAKALMQKCLELEPDNIDVWGTHLNYYASVRDKSQFIYWAKKIRQKSPEYVSLAVIQDLLDKM